MKRLLVFIVLLISFVQSLYSQWERLENVPVDTFLTDIGPVYFCNFYDIHFINNKIGFVAGGRSVPGVSRGYVYKTEDAGLSWNILDYFPSLDSPWNFSGATTAVLFFTVSCPPRR